MRVNNKTFLATLVTGLAHLVGMVSLSQAKTCICKSVDSTKIVSPNNYLLSAPGPSCTALNGKPNPLKSGSKLKDCKG